MTFSLPRLLGVALLACLSVLSLPASADKKAMSKDEFLASLHFQSGKIDLPGKMASLQLPPDFRYLPPEDTKRLLEDGWGNPDGGNTLGMILPQTSPLEESGWGVIITYEKDGHVKDDDADKIDYADLLKEMKEQIQQANAERKKQGFGTVNLIGWAETPRYDQGTHKLYWAKELDFGDGKERTLNYNIRVLGREGVLVLNAVAGMNQIKQIRTDMQQVIGFAEFTDGNRYADYKPGTDRVAQYGLAALVAGSAASKLGFFGKLFALLLAAKKLVVAGLVVLGGFFARLLGRKD